jgi:alanine dehydrogenase
MFVLVVKNGHAILIEKDIGFASGISNEDYNNAVQLFIKTQAVLGKK